VLKRIFRTKITAIAVVLMGLTALMVSVPSAALAQGLSPGTIVNHTSGKCMSNGGSTKNSAPITQYTCDGTNNQEWIWDPDHSTIYNYGDFVNGIDMCLTDGGSTKNSAPITQYTCNGGSNQNWSLIAYDGYFIIENGNLTFCMTDGGSTKNSAPITQYACGYASTNQQWTYDGDGY
jgi:Ricin-type beta-trefoil lectin domain